MDKKAHPVCLDHYLRMKSWWYSFTNTWLTKNRMSRDFVWNDSPRNPNGKHTRCILSYIHNNNLFKTIISYFTSWRSFCTHQKWPCTLQTQHCLVSRVLSKILCPWLKFRKSSHDDHLCPTDIRRERLSENSDLAIISFNIQLNLVKTNLLFKGKGAGILLLISPRSFYQVVCFIRNSFLHIYKNVECQSLKLAHLLLLLSYGITIPPFLLLLQ